jgi:hypothetical protein
MDGAFLRTLFVLNDKVTDPEQVSYVPKDYRLADLRLKHPFPFDNLLERTPRLVTFLRTT